jgi:phage gp29-like protein
VSKKNIKTLTAEVASVRDEIPLFGGIFPNPDRLLAVRGGGKGLELYEELESDAHVRTVIAKRKRAVIAREWVVNEADESDEAKRAAKLVRSHISKISFDKVTSGFLDAVIKGFAVGEVMWCVDDEDGSIRPYEIRLRKQQRFAFVEGTDGLELRLLTLAEPFKGIALPDKKFIRFTHDSRYENPYGFALGNSLFWPVFFKRKGITFWLVFCDKYGSPTSVGRYPASASQEERRTLKEALEAMANDSGIILPEGMDVTLLEAARSGIDTYETLVRYMDEQISEVVLGETGTTNQSGQGGNNARDKIGNEIRLETAKADADALCEVLNETLVKWIIDLNMPGAPYPQVWRNFEQPEDLSLKADRDVKLGQSGVKFTKQYFMREYNLQEGDFELSENAGYGGYPFMQGMNFAAKDEVKSEGKEKTLEQQPDDLNLIPDNLEAQMDGVLLPIIDLINQGVSYEEIMSRLENVYEELDVGALQNMLQRAIFVSSVWGRLNANA